VDGSVRYTVRGEAQVRCGGAGCTVAARVSGRIVGSRPDPTVTGGRATGQLFATVQVDGRPAGGCRASAPLPLPGTGSISCASPGSGAVYRTVEAGKRAAALARSRASGGRPVPYPIRVTAQAEVVAIVPDGRSMLAAHRDGTVCVLDAATRKTTCKERRAGRITAAGSLPWLGGRRLLLATEAGPIACVGFDDELVTQYASAYHELPAVAGSADVVAAVSPDRQRLILWHSWDGRQPAAELHLFGVARHRVADVDFA